MTCAWLFDPAAIAAPGFDPTDAVDFWDVTNRQDWAINELTQLGIGSRAYVPGPYANAEGLLAAFDRYYLVRSMERIGTRRCASRPSSVRARVRRRFGCGRSA